MFDGQLTQDGSTIVGNSDIANVIDEHFIQTDGSQGSLDDVGHGESGRDVGDADVGAGFAGAAEELCVCNE